MECKVQFVNEKLQKAFTKLGEGKFEEKQLKSFLERAFQDIYKNPFCGIQIPKRLIPKEYIKKFNIKNVWKYNLPGAWRLLYSLEGNQDPVTGEKFFPPRIAPFSNNGYKKEDLADLSVKVAVESVERNNNGRNGKAERMDAVVFSSSGLVTSERS